MKIILTQEVTGLGGSGDVVEVKDGYARNYLVPRGLAVRWTRGGEKTVESLRKSRAAKAVATHEHAAEIKAKLEGAPVDLAVRAGAAGRLFGAVTPAEVAAAIAAASGESVDKRTIAIDHPIKSLGEHTVSVRLHDDVSAVVALNVVSA